jgi:hypothetical protein
MLLETTSLSCSSVHTTSNAYVVKTVKELLKIFTFTKQSRYTPWWRLGEEEI